MLPAALVRGPLPGRQITWGLVPLGILGRGVPGGQGESDDIGTRPGTPIGDCLNEPTRGFRKDRKVGDHTAQRREPTDMRRCGGPLPDPTAHLLLTEADHHAGSWQCLLRHRGGNDIVEGTVQVRYRGVQEDPGDRIDDTRHGHRPLTGLRKIQQLALPARPVARHRSGRLTTSEGIVLVSGCHTKPREGSCPDTYVSDGLAQGLSSVRCLPGETGTPEVPVGTGGAVDGAQQVEVPHDGSRAQVEDLVDSG